MLKKSMQDLQRKTVEEFRAAEKSPVVVVLDNIRSMHNVGSVFRTADAFLIDSICLCGYTPQPPHRDIQKTALGATETVNWTYFPSTLDAVLQLKSTGFGIYAVEQAAGSLRLDDIETVPGEKIALVFGNEVNGVDQAVMTHCDGCIEIPQLGMKHSLNISVAAGIVLWEIMRVRIPALLPATNSTTHEHD
ncbi:RNA methyltransferase [Flavihumibacter petaseus]|uniref:Putative RNA methyltransferase n=1 Tax=Flavihumibacter petaseus NBRC 106054 TaxID=1220578 RepID=A0A0E9N158_9BACT|nr:RNA methyltransferase [Flavihumibacter petaseus]GAO43594.1 putative RNA methyltransferase [Flavihumibacter petaseus NBRC 106054]